MKVISADGLELHMAIVLRSGRVSIQQRTVCVSLVRKHSKMETTRSTRVHKGSPLCVDAFEFRGYEARRKEKGALKFAWMAQIRNKKKRVSIRGRSCEQQRYPRRRLARQSRCSVQGAHQWLSVPTESHPTAASCSCAASCERKTSKRRRATGGP